MNRSLYSIYKPASKNAEANGELKEMKSDDWHRLLGLAHKDKSRAFDIYSKLYLATNGQFYRSDSKRIMNLF